MNKETIYLNHNSYLMNLWILFKEIILKDVLFWVKLFLFLIFRILFLLTRQVILEKIELFFLIILLTSLASLFDELGHFFYICIRFKPGQTRYGLGYYYGIFLKIKLINKFYVFFHQKPNDKIKLFYLFSLLFQLLFLSAIFGVFVQFHLKSERMTPFLSFLVIILVNLINPHSDLLNLFKKNEGKELSNANER